MKKIKKFKIRASGAHHIMSGSIGLTDKQEIELQALKDRDTRTAVMDKKVADLQYKKDNLVLPAGVKTYCEDWMTSQVYSRRKTFTSKYTDKGLIVEDDSIDFIGEFLKMGMLLKNEESFEDEFMTGIPDIKLKKMIIDAKNSWDCFTFPLFGDQIDPIYFFQGQVYMHLTGIHSYKVIYVLSDTPMHLIQKEAYWWSKNNGFEDLDDDILQEFIAKMTYDDIDDRLKIKVYDFEYDPKVIAEMITRVKLCRIYIKELMQHVKTLNTK